MLFLVNFTGARVSQAFANAQDFTKAVELFQVGMPFSYVIHSSLSFVGL
jgi:hypothetical protein